MPDCTFCNISLPQSLHEQILHVMRCMHEVSVNNGVPFPCSCNMWQTDGPKTIVSEENISKKRKIDQLEVIESCSNSGSVKNNVLPILDPYLIMIVVSCSLPFVDVHSLLCLSSINKTMYKKVRPLVNERFYMNFGMAATSKTCKFTEYRISYCGDLDLLPPSATHVNIQVNSFKSNQPIHGITGYSNLSDKITFLNIDTFLELPPKLTSLTVTYEVAKSHYCSYQFPQSLTSLTIVHATGTFIPSIIPPNLTTMAQVGCESVLPAGTTFPSSLTSLKNYKLKDQSSFPPNLKEFCGSIALKNLSELKLPSTLLHLTTTISNEQNGALQLPPNLISFKINCGYIHFPYSTYTFGPIPPSLKKLKLFDCNFPIDCLASLSITSLAMGDTFNEPFFKVPQTLQSLSFGDKFNHNIPTLPDSLTKLHLGKNFNRPLDFLPPSLTSLSLGSSFNCPLTNLPQSIRYLSVYLNQDLGHLTQLTSLEIKEINQDRNYILPHVPIKYDNFFETPNVGWNVPFITVGKKIYKQIEQGSFTTWISTKALSCLDSVSSIRHIVIEQENSALIVYKQPRSAYNYYRLVL